MSRITMQCFSLVGSGEQLCRSQQERGESENRGTTLFKRALLRVDRTLVCRSAGETGGGGEQDEGQNARDVRGRGNEGSISVQAGLSGDRKNLFLEKGVNSEDKGRSLIKTGFGIAGNIPKADAIFKQGITSTVGGVEEKGGNASGREEAVYLAIPKSKGTASPRDRCGGSRGKSRT